MRDGLARYGAVLALAWLVASCGGTGGSSDVLEDDDGAPAEDAAPDAGDEDGAPAEDGTASEDSSGGDAEDGAEDGEPLPTGTLTVHTLPAGSPSNVPFLVFRDGDGPWVEGVGTDGTYQFDCTTGRYGVAMAGAQRGQLVDIVFATIADADLLIYRGRPATVAPMSGEIRGSVSGVPTGDGVTLCATGFRERRATLAPPVPATYAMALPAGSYTLTALRTTRGDAQQVFRSGALSVPASSFVTQALAFDGTVPATIERSVVLSGLGPSDTYELSSALLTDGDEGCPLSTETAGDAVRLVAESLLDPTEIHRLRLAATGPTAEDVRSATVHSRAAAATTLELPPGPSVAPVVSIASTAPVRLAADFEPQPWVELVTLIVEASPPVSWRVDATPRWLGGAGHLEVPDLDGAPGWGDAGNLPAGEALSWTLRMIATTNGTPLPGVQPSVPPPDGYGERTIVREGSLTATP